MADTIQKRVSQIHNYRRLFSSQYGQKVLANLCQRFGVFDPYYDSDPNHMYYKQGQRSVILEIVKMTKLDPADLEKLAEEE